MKHLLSILILFGFMTVLSHANKCTTDVITYFISMGTASEKNCAEYGCDYSYATKMCVQPIKKTQFGDPALTNGLKIPIYDKTKCINSGYYWHGDNICRSSSIDLSNIGSGVDISAPKTPTQIQNQTILIVVAIVAAFIIYLLVSASVKKTKEAYKASTIPLKNKVKRKELETRLSELEDVTPAEQTYAKSSYEDETEEIREVKKLERQIKIKKLKKELKDLEAEEE